MYIQQININDVIESGLTRQNSKIKPGNLIGGTSGFWISKMVIEHVFSLALPRTTKKL